MLLQQYYHFRLPIASQVDKSDKSGVCRVARLPLNLFKNNDLPNMPLKPTARSIPRNTGTAAPPSAIDREEHFNDGNRGPFRSRRR